jgi:hypothetical protein
VPHALVRHAAQSLPIAAQAIIRAVAYADIFDQPLTAAEIHRYLPGLSMPLADVEEMLLGAPLCPGYLSCTDGFYALSGREHLVEVRRRRATAAARLWPEALWYANRIARLPFVRMVAITGSLACDNPEPGDDIDYMIVTAPGRLWLCRALVIGAVIRLAANRRTLCPNFLVSERALEVPDHSIFSAYELMQMRPIAGIDVYRRLIESNEWLRDLLPNARQLAAAPEVRPDAALGWRAVGALLGSPLGEGLERWEMGRKVRRLTHQPGDHSEAFFSADCCKGHFGGHRTRALAALNERLGQLGLEAAGS